jgi:hypothetical protein
MNGPDRVPLFIFEGDRDRTDIVQVNVEDFYQGPDSKHTEWGFDWATTGDQLSMGVPMNPPLEDFNQLERYLKTTAPDPFASNRFALADSTDPGDAYFMGSLPFRVYDNELHSRVREPCGRYYV